MKYIFLILLSALYLSANSIGLKKESPQSEKENFMVYKDMLAYLENSKDSTQLVALGTIYVNGIVEPDSTGAIVKKDPYIAESYFLKAIKRGNVKALSILSGFYLYNQDMRKLDPELKKAEQYLKEAYTKGDMESSVLLSNVYFEKNKHKEGVEVLLNASSNNDSGADLALAFLFKDGLFNNGEIIVKKDLSIAEHYLNKACSNKDKSDKVKELCFNNKEIHIENR